MQDFICGTAHAVRAGHVGVTGFHCSSDTYQRPVDPDKIVYSSIGCRGGAVFLIIGSDGFFHIGPELIEIANFCPKLRTVQRNTGRHRLHRQICVALAIHYNGVCFILASNVPLDGVRILDCSQTDKVCQFGIKLIQHLNDPIKIEVMEIGVGRFVNGIDTHNSISLIYQQTKVCPDVRNDFMNGILHCKGQLFGNKVLRVSPCPALLGHGVVIAVV